MLARLVIAALVVGLLPSPVAAQSPIADALAAYAQAPAVPDRAVPVPKDNGATLIWGGVGLLAGGGLLEVLSYTALKNVSSACVIGYYAYACADQYSTNKGALIGGLSVAAIGAVMLEIGMHRRDRSKIPEITIGHGGVTIGKTLRF